MGGFSGRVPAGARLSAAFILAVSAVLLALALSLAPASPPLLYAIPGSLATLAVYLHTGLLQVLGLGFGAVIAQLLLGVAVSLRSWEPSCFPLLALSSHIVFLSAYSIATGRGEARVWGWLSVALLGACWSLEARALALEGATADSMLGRIHILLLATAALTALYLDFLSEHGWRRVLGLFSASAPVLVIALVQGGLLARDVYDGEPLLSLFALYALAVARSLYSSPAYPRPGAGLRPFENWIVKTGLVLAIALFSAMTLLEVAGLNTPRDHSETLRASLVPGLAALALFSGALSGSLLGAVGAVIAGLASAWLAGLAGLATPPVSYAIGGAVASAIIVATARRRLGLYAPLLVVLVAAPLVLATPVEQARVNTVILDLGSEHVDGQTGVVLRAGRLEELEFDKRENIVKGRVLVEVGYGNRTWRRTLDLRFYYSMDRGEWVFEKPLEIWGRAGADLVRVEVKPAPSLEAFLQTYYLVMLAGGSPALEPAGSLIAEIEVFKRVEETALRIAALACLPGLSGILLEKAPLLGFARREEL